MKHFDRDRHLKLPVPAFEDDACRTVTQLTEQLIFAEKTPDGRQRRPGFG